MGFKSLKFLIKIEAPEASMVVFHGKGGGFILIGFILVGCPENKSVAPLS